MRCQRTAAVLVVLALTTALVGCGFRLATVEPLPYASLHVAMPAHTEFGLNLRRAIRSSGSTLVPDMPDQAQAILTPTLDARDKNVLSFNSAGRAREFQLRQRFGFRVHDARGRDLIDPVVITLARDYSFDDASVLAKEQEEALLWRDMENDLVQQILSRLAAVRPRAPVAE